MRCLAFRVGVPRRRTSLQSTTRCRRTVPPNLSQVCTVTGGRMDRTSRRRTRVRSENDAAYVEFVDASRSTLLAYAWLLTADGHAAEELVQETLVRVYVRWRRLRSSCAA